MRSLSEQHVAMSYLIDEHIEALAITHSPNTIRGRRQALEGLHAELEHGLAYATTKAIRAYLANPDWSKNTRHTIAGHIIGAYRWWCDNGYLDGNPVAKLKRPPQPKGIPRPAPEQAIALLLSLPEPIPTITLLGAYAGLRRSEIAGCWREHISADLILIPVAKGGHPQSVPTHPLIWEHVRNMPPGPLIRTIHGRQATSATLGEMWQRARASLGLGDLVLHQLRHRCGTEVLRATNNLRKAQRVLRHSTIATTERYTQVTDAEVFDAVKLLPPVKVELAAIQLDPKAG